MQAKLSVVVLVPAHDVHDRARIVDDRGAEDSIFGKVGVPTIEAEVLGLGLAQPLRPDQRILRLRHRRLLVGIICVDRVVHRRHDHRVEGSFAVQLQA